MLESGKQSSKHEERLGLERIRGIKTLYARRKGKTQKISNRIVYLWDLHVKHLPVNPAIVRFLGLIDPELDTGEYVVLSTRRQTINSQAKKYAIQVSGIIRMSNFLTNRFSAIVPAQDVAFSTFRLVEMSLVDT